MLRRWVMGTGAVWVVSMAIGLAQAPAPAPAPPAPRAADRQPLPRTMVDGHRGSLFVSSENCLACHNGLVTTQGENVSIGSAWRASMMANASRDPYWQASVRRELLDHPAAAGEIEDECSVCHMPMSHTTERAAGGRGRVFAHLPLAARRGEIDLLAGDAVSCTACHQIQAQGLGTPESFTGGYAIDRQTPFEQRALFGPYAVDRSRATIMHSATGFTPTEGRHLQTPELCATCHTLYTTARGANGEPIGRLPEQVPYLEWRHSDYRDRETCQSCHMPVVPEATRIASVLGEPRAGLSRHLFRGGNFFMLRMLNRYRDELDVAAPASELEAEAAGTLASLQRDAARLSILRTAVERDGHTLIADVIVENLTGHKLPTAYPSRRAWIHFTVRDARGGLLFESGRLAADGRIEGNDNDAEAARFEPHYAEITRAEQVQIYESILGDPQGRVTTGLLSAVDYLKDNRLLPRGFDKATASRDIAVRGDALSDDGFIGGGDTVRYTVPLGRADGPFVVTAELCYQPIGFRWAHNLEGYDASEPRRFTQYYREMSSGTAAILATATATAIATP
jgi:hypothetical protein